MKQYDIALLGGDARIAYMHPYLLQKGYRVIGYGTERISDEDESSIILAETWKEAIEQSDCIVGGIPLFREGKLCFNQNLPNLPLENLYRCMRKNQIIFGGVIPEAFVEGCRDRNLSCYDFMKDEPLSVFNAISTAEGAILEALKNQNTNIHGSKTLVLGYGRCGRVLAEKLKGLGARVTVCSRCEIELACADTFGLDTLLLTDLKEKVHAYEYIYNTIPALVLSKDILKEMKRSVLVIDIASGLGGVDFVSAKKLEICALHCLGLPGKYAPKISAKGLADFVIRKMK